MRYYTVSDGIVIRRLALPSGDVVVTLLNQAGKWRAVARKGTLPGGNLGRLSLFHDVSVQFYRKNDDDLALLTQVQLNGALPRLSDPDVYPYAHLITELADALTVDVHLGERLYDYLASGLRGLNAHPDPEHVALLYAWHLLAVAGLAPRLTTCVRCGRDLPLTAFDVAGGGLACEECAELYEATPLPPHGPPELRNLVSIPLGRALARPPADRALHWRLLERYTAYHAHELRSFGAVRALRSSAPCTEAEVPHHV